MIARATPIVLWVNTNKNDRKITVSVTDDLLLKYQISSSTGTPLGAEYIHPDFYRDRPNVAHNDWQKHLVLLLEETYDILIISQETP